LPESALLATELSQILDQIAADPATRTIAEALRAPAGARLRVAPLIGAARPPLVAALARQLGGPLLYVVGSGDAALRARADLCMWLDAEDVLLFPASDAFPYEHMSPGADVLAGRLRVLARLAAQGIGIRDQGSSSGHPSGQPSAPPTLTPGPRPVVIVAPLKALTQPTLTPEEWAEAAVWLRQGAAANPDDLVRHWLELGYRAAPTVEEPGELNRRGGILDIFPPGDDAPLRIEFFGDEIDSLRRFDPLSQRSQSREREALVGPPHDIPLWRREAALARIADLSLDTLRPEAREEWQAAAERLATGERFEGRAFYAPFFRDPSRIATLLDHLPPSAPVLASELMLLRQQAAELERQAEEQRESRIAGGELPPDFPRPYLLWNELLARGRGRTVVDLSNNEEGPGAGDIEQADGAATIHPSPHPLAPPPFVVTELFGGQLKRLVADIAARLRAGEQVAVVTPQAARIQELVEEALGQGSGTSGQGSPHTAADGRDGVAASLPRTVNAEPRTLFTVVHGSLDAGWRAPGLNLTLYTDAEIFGWRERRPVAERKRKTDKSAEERAAFLRGLKVGDHVVHIEHGIAVFDGLVRRIVGGIEREYLNLRYAEGDRLYVPVDQVDRVSRYIGSGENPPQLTRLGTQEWERTKRKVRAAVQELANELLDLYARRQLSEGHAFSPDTEWQRELEASFPYNETDDQLRAIAEVKQDMEQPQPMDRLICGDVGFGKTEVALRAAFKAVQDGMQVAVLVPTTVLAQQHYETFSRRMAAFPVAVEMISRFRSAKEQDEIVRRLARGEIDIIIGTHRLLSKDVVFKNLGLLIVDEEQRFGVRHKERIKQMRANVDVLTLTATPIPRTLHMALAGIRDLSVIDTPPEERLPVKTYLLPIDERTTREAILREIDRGGQVFYLHNRVQSIYYVANKLKQLVPEAEIAVGHGQMDEKELERVMLDFFAGKDDVLVCTTIIENGLDVPNANTIIIDDATHYGLAQLYQLRGRVGRSSQRAYAYLFYPPDRRLTAEAQERLLAIQEATELGAGLRIAMRDLEIRGAGNLLGAEQSGHIAAVGFDLYSRLLRQAVETMKAQFDALADVRRTANDERALFQGAAGSAPDGQRRSAVLRPSSPIKVDEKVLVSPLVTLDLPLDAYLPPEYVADEQVRLEMYQRLAEVQTPAQVRDLRQELRDRFGEPPAPAEQLLTWLLIKALCLQAGVPSVVTTDEEFIVRLPELGPAARERLRRSLPRDPAVRLGPQFLRLDRRSVRDAWVAPLTGLLETLAGVAGVGAQPTKTGAQRV
jgi:transcription-repair coupling factor (superfamily II helicase)